MRRSARCSGPKTSTSTTPWRRSSRAPRSIFSKMYALSRYGKGDGEDYWNCPLSREQYEGFLDALLAGETVPIHDFEKGIYFEGCLPIEVMAERGRETLRHGPMKPMGLPDPRTGRLPWAVVQLRQDDLAAGALQPRGLPDEAEDSGTATGLSHDPGSGERGVRALRDASPQHLHSLARPSRSLLAHAQGARVSSSRARSRESRATSRARPRGFQWA